jgi:hypothetical protein
VGRVRPDEARDDGEVQELLGEGRQGADFMKPFWPQLTGKP